MYFKYAFLILIFSFQLANCQKAPIKFGKIEKKDLEMTVYEKDSTAPAVILCDYGYFDANEFKFNRILRIKILKKEGYEWANRSFPSSSQSTIRGITYNLENGEIVKEKLKGQSIFKERITNSYYKFRVAMPNVKVGSVIEMSFSYQGIPSEWKFQDKIPVKWSELRLSSSQYIRYQKNFFGYEPLAIATNNRWVGIDMPAFKEEPYMNSSENYITKFEFDLLDISFPGFYQSFTTSWEAVSNLLYDDSNFGGAISASAYLNAIAKKINELNFNDEQKIETAYYEIKKIKWNEKHRLFTSSPNLNYVYKNEVGNSADINLALFQLLTKLDFITKPVVLSTRENGMLSPVYPSLNKLNHVIVYVKLNDKEYLLDATEDYAPFDLLPKKCLNYQGRIVEKEKSNWIALNTSKKDREIVFYSLKLEEDLSLKGELNCVRYDYAAWNFRKKYHSFNSKDEFLNDYTQNKAGLNVLNSNFKNIDSVKLPIKEICEVEITDQITQIGDNYYLTPSLYERIQENPFKLEDRKYPVDFGYKTEKTIKINIAIPEGYEILEMPEPLNIQLPGNTARFYYRTEYMNGMIMFNAKLEIDKELFLPTEYQTIKNFFDIIINKQSEPVVLKKSI